MFKAQPLHGRPDAVIPKRLVREEVEFGFEGALAAPAVDVDADAEVDFRDAFFEAEILQFADADGIVGVGYLVGDGEDFGHGGSILIG